MRSFVRAKVLETSGKLSAIKLVGRKSPRAAHRLLTSCATKLLSFLASTVPPDITLPELREFDLDIEQTFFSIISPSGIVTESRSFGLFKSVDPLLYKLR